jgi:hypothetical protein
VEEDVVDNLMARLVVQLTLAGEASGAAHFSLSELASKQISRCCSNETLIKRTNYYQYMICNVIFLDYWPVFFSRTVVKS